MRSRDKTIGVMKIKSDHNIESRLERKEKKSGATQVFVEQL
jgi:hypothetical protein